MQGNLRPPDIPSGMHSRVQRTNPIRVKGSRYFIAAGGSLRILSVERAKSSRTAYYKLRDSILLLERRCAAGSHRSSAHKVAEMKCRG